MKKKTRASYLALLSLAGALSAQAQEIRTEEAQQPSLPEWTWNLKTNLLYDATTTMNLGVEFRTGGRTSLELPVNYNPWTFANNRKWKHVGVQPELRWWPKGTFNRHFFGVHAHYAQYNVANLPDPFSDYMKANRFEGWLTGAGVTYGYRWNFRNTRVGLEAAIGVGYAYKDYDRFECFQCGEKIGESTDHYFGPTKAAINLVVGLGRRPEPVRIYVPPVYAAEPVPAFLASFITPDVEAVKSRFEVGRAYLDFVVNRSDILPDFRNNAAELQKIRASIESVRSNPDATITGINIAGYASPEGDAVSNQSLSERRSVALGNYIGATYGLPNNLLSVWGMGEDWAGLDSLVAGSMLVGKGQLIDIIRSGGDADQREGRLKTVAGGEPYRRLLADFYPILRRSDYMISYTVSAFTVEQGKEVMKTRPGTLSLNEMFLIATTYPVGSDAFNEVFETAVRIFPDSDVANLNAAASALNRKDTTSASYYLNRVKERTAAYWNNMGILLWFQGDKAASADAFARAGSLGVQNAAEIQKYL